MRIVRLLNIAATLLSVTLAGPQPSHAQATGTNSQKAQEEAFSLLVEGSGAYDRGDFSKALDRFRAVASLGSGPTQGQAQYYLGRMYHEGKGVTPDLAEAIRWWSKAAEQGNALAQKRMGMVNLVGSGVPQDYSEAVQWFRRAAEQGDGGSQVLLGTCYQEGNGVSRNYTEAVRWFRLGAQQGNPLGQAYLGLAYSAGQGVVQDYVQAHIWLNLAASRIGDIEIIGKDVVEARDGLANKMTREQIGEAQRLASEWSKKFR